MKTQCFNFLIFVCTCTETKDLFENYVKIQAIDLYILTVKATKLKVI